MANAVAVSTLLPPPMGPDRSIGQSPGQTQKSSPDEEEDLLDFNDGRNV